MRRIRLEFSGAWTVAVVAVLSGCSVADSTPTETSEASVVATVDLALISDPVGFCPTSGKNVIVGTQGNDTLTGTPGADCIVGLGGNDLITGEGGDDIIFLGDGDDTGWGDS